MTRIPGKNSLITIFVLDFFFFLLLNDAAVNILPFCCCVHKQHRKKAEKSKIKQYNFCGISVAVKTISDPCWFLCGFSPGRWFLVSLTSGSFSYWHLYLNLCPPPSSQHSARPSIPWTGQRSGVTLSPSSGSSETTLCRRRCTASRSPAPSGTPTSRSRGSCGWSTRTSAKVGRNFLFIELRVRGFHLEWCRFSAETVLNTC